MPERDGPSLEGVRDAMRAHDNAAPERAGSGVTDLAEGVQFAELDPSGEDRFQRLRQELGVSSFGMNLIRLRPGERSRIHRHERQEEVYLVLDGTLHLAIEGEEHELGRHKLARVAPDTRRQLTNRGDDVLLILALGGAREHEGRDGVAYESWDATEGKPPQDVPFPEPLE